MQRWWRVPIVICGVLVSLCLSRVGADEPEPKSEGVAPTTLVTVPDVPPNTAVLLLAATPDEKRMAVCLSGTETVYVLDPQRPQRYVTLEGHLARVNAAAFTPDGNTVVTADGGGHLGFWNTKTGRLLRKANAQSQAVRKIAFLPDGKTLAVVNGSFSLYDATTAKLHHRFEGTDHYVLAISADGKRAATSGTLGNVLLFDLAGQKFVSKIETERMFLPHLALSPDGSRLAVAWRASAEEPSRVKIYNTATGKLEQVIPEVRGEVFALAFSPDGKTLTGMYMVKQADTADTHPGFVHWNAADGTRLHLGTLGEVRQWSFFSVSGILKSDRFLTADDGKVQRWLLKASDRSRPRGEVRK